ncbi:uncharacterized protein RCO7_02762 [Rhynchosporium graminicola]|uniref:NB-ARC domain-containing protein n=1 Tax=Rhynchosporium graminicola TaxID=2792576 RepID=A0A1E1KSW8_9HELO|nr:uncharacterized protein RCO7_02762 [Rhynchosporium commune]
MEPFETNNPIFQLVKEVGAEFFSQEISTIVSLGTGVSDGLWLGNGLVSVAQGCVKVATDTDKEADRFLDTHCTSSGIYEGKYFRFDVTKGLGGVGLEEWQKHDEMWSNTLSYLNRAEQRELFDVCANRLRGGLNRDSQLVESFLAVGESGKVIEDGAGKQRERGKHRETKWIGESPNNGHDLGLAMIKGPRTTKSEQSDSESKFFQLDRIGKQPVKYFASRSQLSKIQKAFAAEQKSSTTDVVALVGLGGSGKTQLMLIYAYTQRDLYGVVLWIDARDMESLLESFELAAAQLGLLVPPTIAWDKSLPEQVSKYSQLANAIKVHDELRRRQQKWLLLFDEVDNLSHVRSTSILYPCRSERIRDSFITPRRMLSTCTKHDKRVKA